MRVVFFSGQGSQQVGMGTDLINNFKVVRDIFEEASDLSGIDLVNICTNYDQLQLKTSNYLQLAILVTNIAYYKIYMEIGKPTPNFMVGHSLGEIIALTCSNAISFSSALSIVKKRGEIMAFYSKKSEGMMLSITTNDLSSVNKLISEYSDIKGILEVACINSPNQIVVSGNKNKVTLFKRKLDELNINNQLLSVNGAFHSSIMNEALDEIKYELFKHNYTLPNCTVISSVSSKPYLNSSEIVENLSLQMIRPVLWSQVISQLLSSGVNEIIEVSPKKTLLTLLRDYPKKIIESIEQFHCMEIVNEILTKRSLLLSFSNELIRQAVSSKNFNVDLENHELIVKQFSKLIKLKEAITEGEVKLINSFNGSLAVEDLNELLSSKLIPHEELHSRIQSITNNNEFKEFLNA